LRQYRRRVPDRPNSTTPAGRWCQTHRLLLQTKNSGTRWIGWMEWMECMNKERGVFTLNHLLLQSIDHRILINDKGITLLIPALMQTLVPDQLAHIHMDVAGQQGCDELCRRGLARAWGW